METKVKGRDFYSMILDSALLLSIVHSFVQQT